MGATAVDTGGQLLELGRVADLLVVEPEDDVARPDPDRFRRPGHALDEDPALDAQLRALLGREVGHAQPQRVARRGGFGGRALLGAGLPVGRHLPDGDRQVAVLPAAPYTDVGLRAGRRAADDAWQVARAL